MVQIILNGCNGKMGKVVSNLAQNSDTLSIVAGIDRNSSGTYYPVFSSIEECNVSADVILDFSRPDALDSLIKYAKSNNLGVILCTTGYSDNQIKTINDISKEIPVFRSANMSIGVNVVNNILKNISALLYKNFDIEVIEKHHNQKVDSPSGTALLLADTIKASLPEEVSYVNGRNGIRKRKHNEIGIHSIRGGSIVGEHEIIFAGQGETIEIKHTALSRDVFAVGALKACEFMYKKEKGLYSMDDVISVKN
ncbi:4-hydroxy-tetrahydrodipicolinate reductase [Clostridium algifaecis]|uniref:4-hydroxy-tetrahydrodipicolinate reductase n=1 Tax=Clostridium algifaecis TaxID=1472040 RepID=A0ABS4KTI9_9CLOT|nr:4-hydroxy-tetrahydrodipicolinate reductase [Clostridium algifaecis]MBP2033373.1 4-hydroxy-tetrahydrodipicolinate reductase [Clostridium algifaecis]